MNRRQVQLPSAVSFFGVFFMPPINTQGSRGGLVTALVVFTILFVTAAIFAIYFNVQLRAVELDLTNNKKTYNDVVREAELGTSDMSALQALKADPSSGMASETLMGIALKQRGDLTKDITGGSGDAMAAQKSVTTTLTAAAASAGKVGVKLPSNHDNLLGAVTTLTDALNMRQSQIKDLQDQLKKAQDDLTTANASIDVQNKAREKSIADAQAQANAEIAKLNDQFNANKSVVDQLQKDQSDAAKKSLDAAQAGQTQLADINQQLTKANAEKSAAEDKLSYRRPDVSNSAIRQSDGRIIRLPGNNICYINLGQGDQVSAGLTFEVYSQATGVPPIPPNVTGDEQLPAGKASIEITRVGATSSECRIVHVSPGAVLSEGDVIANLVYDPNTKYNFFVYGDFDLADTGHPNAADEQVIERLVSQWGANLVKQVNVDTDFVVLGKEPTLPTYTKEELQNPQIADNMAKAQATIDKYNEIRQIARDLHIPVLNQNRFLYYVGYYDQAKR
jgi:hypothetical protein